ncbi:anthranilate phosphoribosyltransferase [Pseudomonas sp. PCH199]|uniref:anthranilate phosphoribosyltransferase n=1 Tax=unclassified Pseudomonas TaxID=196821 RepID=UPI000BCC2887|nr:MULTISPECIES: anthranilate phosphoribosyltransferase [unclassified Pseudomonas]MCW8277429.1 anthranilate phosphoribosyltransferase [Pseudomonas sp. PCH199]PAM82368.1 anthranilate phosphoribosyltransferase [Pseudomonas sp. ERMR1:02]
MSTVQEARQLPCADYHQVIRQLVEERADLSRLETRQVVEAILNRQFSDLQIAATLVALSRKGETADEVAGAVDAILSRSSPLQTGFDNAVDIGGTGGDRAGTFNISTTAAFVAAAVGVPVVKHGNRSVTSRCGSSDMIAVLGVDVERRSSAQQIRADLAAYNFAFVATSSFHRFAPRIGEIRREIGVRSLFNLAGPLVHPAAIKRQLIGVARPSQLGLIADALLRLGREEAFVVHGVDGLDEVSCVGETLVAHVRHGTVETFSVHPRDFGVEACRMEDLAGGDPLRNAQLCTAIIEGERGPRSDAVVIAASALLVLSAKAESFLEGASMARAAIDSGKAYQVFQRFLGHGL